jgi:signal transduction histidine kinase
VTPSLVSSVPRAARASGGHPVELATLRAAAPDPAVTWVAVQVSDTGLGIAERDHDRIFNEFEQVNPGSRGDSERRGTGLGLPISRRLARLLGGDVTVSSDERRGSTFTIWLPVN